MREVCSPQTRVTKIQKFPVKMTVLRICVLTFFYLTGTNGKIIDTFLIYYELRNTYLLLFRSIV